MLFDILMLHEEQTSYFLELPEKYFVRLNKITDLSTNNKISFFLLFSNLFVSLFAIVSLARLSFLLLRSCHNSRYTSNNVYHLPHTSYNGTCVESTSSFSGFAESPTQRFLILKIAVTLQNK